MFETNLLELLLSIKKPVELVSLPIFVGLFGIEKKFKKI